MIQLDRFMFSIKDRDVSFPRLRRERVGAKKAGHRALTLKVVLPLPYPANKPHPERQIRTVFVDARESLGGGRCLPYLETKLNRKTPFPFCR